MGGICGVVDFGMQARGRIELSSMIGRLAHRGPDGSHTYVRADEGVGIGEVQIDAFRPDGAPAHSIECGDVVVALDGGLTNRPDLFDGAATGSLPAVPATDHAAVAQAYGAHGADVPRALNGPVALAVWDKRKKSILLARDKFGERSLYFYLDPDAKKLIFASEIKAILAEGSVAPELDRESLSIYLAFGFVPGSRTLYRNIRKLLPGECLQIDASMNPRRTTYWRIPPRRATDIDEVQSVRRLRDLFLSALERNVNGAQEVAVFLSGGLDSSVVVAGLREIGVPRIGTFTAGFEVPGKLRMNEDLKYARIVADAFGTEHHEAVFRPGEDPTSRLTRSVRQLDDLILTPNTCTRELLAQKMQAAGFNAAVTGVILEPWLHDKKKRDKLWRKTQDCATEEERLFRWRNGLFDLQTQNDLLKSFPEDAKSIILESIRECSPPVEGEDFFTRLLRSAIALRVAEKSLRELESVGAMTGIEVRSPGLDPRIAEFMMSLPESFDGGKTLVGFRPLFLEAFAGDLPTAIVERKKIGFPSYYWNSGELAQLQDRLLGRENIDRMGLFDYEPIQVILAKDRESEKKSAGKKSWALTQFAMWHEDHFGTSAERVPA
jgi:asparagine synthase (glutamine-hydrolysing)